jgi:copper chaperone CopZ
MITELQPEEKLGILVVTGGVRTEEEARAIKAGLEDVPGVHEVEFAKEGVRIRFNSDLANDLKFYEAVKNVGFHASTFRIER